ncbi:MAG: CsbD family protein [Gammaproteobacteria bacterium]|nr:CsbD family protein [Gammaproteobacteria bacterium]
MNNLNLVRYIIEGNWEEIKGELQTNWAKLTDNDMEKIDGSYKQLLGKLQKLYGYKAAEAESELRKFFESSNFQKLVNKTYNKMEDIKEIVVTTLDEYLQSAKQKSTLAEKTIVDYVSAHPFKTIGLAAMAGLLIGCAYKSKE